MTQQLLEDVDYTQIVTEDDTPVDNFQSEKQQRLLVEPLYSSWQPGVPFIAAANVGLFYALKQDPLVPDALLSLGVEVPDDWSKKQNRSYFAWEIGKFPEVVIEIVSNCKGDELGDKKDAYARMGIACYAVFDPLKQLQGEDELNGALLKVWALQQKRYVELPTPYWLESVELGLTLWEGTFEGRQDLWLRWCDRSRDVILTGAERAGEAEERAGEAEERADEAEQKAQRLAERLRAMGINPDEI
ncbi:MAG: Uma2 family endonuclease [Chroococcidiopsidaceae cyanobacterium CP_BM_ER_R8_30]|nr:Uma2 family endonuclease [Chroococcidiopsidaceae cyanobacterium CP_BM_ER_R8_30]